MTNDQQTALDDVPVRAYGFEGEHDSPVSLYDKNGDLIYMVYVTRGHAEKFADEIQRGFNARKAMTTETPSPTNKTKNCTHPTVSPVYAEGSYYTGEYRCDKCGEGVSDQPSPTTLEADADYANRMRIKKECDKVYLKFVRDNCDRLTPFTSFRTLFEDGFEHGIAYADRIAEERLKAERAKILLEYAVQQFTGFHEAVRGRNDVIDLVQSMGLTKPEFKKIRKDLGFMHHDELEELDEYFKKENSK